MRPGYIQPLINQAVRTEEGPEQKRQWTKAGAQLRPDEGMESQAQ
jgi:hypothetical protein